LPAFIETQFPIARLSAEAYKERKAGASQTLTGLGKWWGRKPLILVRASILGMLMPASNNSKKDREIFLKILTMDDSGTWNRCKPAVQRKSSRTAFDGLPYPLVEDEVINQIKSMQALDEGGEPNFNDADYQLAAYAAALKVLTQYGKLDGRDVEHEVFSVRTKNEKSDFQTVIERALGIACETLIPRGLDNSWRNLSLVERYYLRALDIESRGERRNGMYEELARGFGVTDIKPLLNNDKANGARMFTPSGFAASLMGQVQSPVFSEAALPGRQGRAASGTLHPFATSPLRHLIFAVRETAAADNSPEPGRQYLRDTFGQAYWGKREGFVALLEWFSSLGDAKGMTEWLVDSGAARILAGRLRNDHA